MKIPPQSLWEAAKGVFGMIVKDNEETFGVMKVFTFFTEMIAPQVQSYVKTSNCNLYTCTVYCMSVTPQ